MEHFRDTRKLQLGKTATHHCNEVQYIQRHQIQAKDTTKVWIVAQLQYSYYLSTRSLLICRPQPSKEYSNVQSRYQQAPNTLHFIKYRYSSRGTPQQSVMPEKTMLPKTAAAKPQLHLKIDKNASHGTRM